MSSLKKATVKSTGRKVQVYRHHYGAGGWVDYSDMETEYQPKELIFDKE